MASSTSLNRFVAIFDRLWKSDAFLYDLDFDAKLADVVLCEQRSSFSGADFLSSPQATEEVKNFLIQRLEYGLNGVDLCVFILRAAVQLKETPEGPCSGVATQILRAQKICEVVDDTLNDRDLIDDIKLDFPRVEDALLTVRSTFDVADMGGSNSKLLRQGMKNRRLRILAVRNGLNPDSELAKKVRQFAELRIPSSPLVRETGSENPGGAAGEEMRNILTEHLQKRKPLYEEEEDLLRNSASEEELENARKRLHINKRQPFYDLFLTYSRGSVYLEKIWVGTKDEDEKDKEQVDPECFLPETRSAAEEINMPACLVLSPPGQIGRDLLAVAANHGRRKILVAYAGNDIIADPDTANAEDVSPVPGHPVVEIGEVEDLLGAHKSGKGIVVFERERLHSWADGVTSLIERTVNLQMKS